MQNMNRRLERKGELPTECWREWLWECDPQAPISRNTLVNRSHLLGLLLCRFWATSTPSAQRAIQQQGPDTCAPTHSDPHETERLMLMQKPPEEMNLKELRDTIDNLTIELPAFAETLYADPGAPEHIRVVEDLLNACFARFGTMVAATHDESTFNDSVAVELVEPGQFKLTKAFMRRTLCIFLSLFRNVYMWNHSVSPAHPAAQSKFTKHHIEASNDDYHTLCMHASLPIGAALAYKVDFAGMYNHISQVVYFHNSKYERIARPPLEDIVTGDPLHCLPAIAQMHPEIERIYEVDGGNVTATHTTWRWAVFPGRIYLVAPDATAYYSPDIMQLYAVFLRANERGSKRQKQARTGGI